jgi:hypothetical protein
MRTKPTLWAVRSTGLFGTDLVRETQGPFKSDLGFAAVFQETSPGWLWFLPTLPSTR